MTMKPEDTRKRLQYSDSEQVQSARTADYCFSEQPVRCVECGQFISLQSAIDGTAHHEFEPDNHFGPERSEWTCKRCAAKERSKVP